jgi:hypothetical protein
MVSKAGVPSTAVSYVPGATMSGDDCDSYLRLLGGEVPQDLVAFFLCSNSTADGVAVVKKLSYCPR